MIKFRKCNLEKLWRLSWPRKWIQIQSLICLISRAKCEAHWHLGSLDLIQFQTRFEKKMLNKSDESRFRHFWYFSWSQNTRRPCLPLKLPAVCDLNANMQLRHEMLLCKIGQIYQIFLQFCSHSPIKNTKQYMLVSLQRISRKKKRFFFVLTLQNILIAL